MKKICRPLKQDEILTVYETWGSSHFPFDELKPLSSIRSLIDRKQYSGYGLFSRKGETESLLGYALLLHDAEKRKMLLDYYAFLEEQRNKGFGSIFLQNMRKQTDFPGCYLECEDPDTASSGEEKSLRRRRIGFYQRNGAFLTQVRACLFGVTYRMLWLPSSGDVGTEDGFVEAVGTDSVSPAEDPGADSIRSAEDPGVDSIRSAGGRKRNREPEGDEAFLQDITDFYLSVFPRSVFDKNMKLWLP
nr:hypothetical protein [uncultured Eisenbergiella sp.]